MSPDKPILITLGGGGHTEQMLRLSKQLVGRATIAYVVANVITARWFRNVARALRIVARSRPAAVVTAGPNFALPLLLVARLAGVPTIYVETWSRVRTKSLSGKFFYRFVDRFYVQWREQLRIYPRAQFCGRLG